MYRQLFTVFFVVLTLSVGANASKVHAETVAGSDVGTDVDTDAETGAPDLASLVDKLESINSIAGDFIQFVEDKSGARGQYTEGSFKAKRPGYFYWHTKSPLEQTIFSDGMTVTVYDPDLEQATVQATDSRTENTPAVLFSGNLEQIGALYGVTILSESAAFTEYELRPKGEESLFETLRIKFTGKHLSDMRLKDSLGQKSVINFIQTEINLDLPDSAFKANFPPGTDVIEDVPLTSFDS